MSLKPIKNKYKEFKTSELGVRLARLARLMEDEKMSLIIIIDGWECSGRGEVISSITRQLNPKFYDVEVFDKRNEKENCYPFLHRFWKKIPKYGNIKIFDRSFYYELMRQRNISQKKLEKRIDGISEIEKILYDDNNIIVKFFLDIDEKEQKLRIKELENIKYKSFYVTNEDKEQNDDYDKFEKHFEKIIDMTNFKDTPWYIIDSNDVKLASRNVLGILEEKLTEQLERLKNIKEAGEKQHRDFVLSERPLSKLDLSLKLSEEEYDSKLKDLQKEAAKIMLEFYNKDIPSMLVFEGMDAAGKDGGIERLIKYMDPRLYNEYAIFAPDETEKAHHYLWRFYNKIPADGKVGIFSRSWYGRVMVERVEGFATENEWERAYEEIVKFEKEFTDHGGFILKYFVAIDKDEQLKRFKDRENEPDKQYKITEEDWRNREKWDVYLDAMNEMLIRTDTKNAPWIIVEGNDKPYARIKILEEFIKRANEFLKNK